MISRRSFLGGCVAGGALAGCRTLAPWAERPYLTVGILSDPHVDARYPHRAELVVQALTRLREKGVEAVIVAGDLTDRGLVSDLRGFADAWFSVFPGGCDGSGARVALFAVYGNRDFMCSGATPEAFRKKYEKDAIRTDPVGAWRTCFGESGSADFSFRMIRGVPFFGAHWGAEKGDVAGFVRRHAAEIDPAKPFFFVQHPPPAGTCFSVWEGGMPHGATVEALSTYPHAIAVSGHSHLSLADNSAVWHGAFTSVPGGSTFDAISRDDVPLPRRVTRSQAAVMRLYADRVVYSRFDVLTGETLMHDLVWSLPDPIRDGEFRFATWNIGHFSWGKSSESTIAAYESRRNIRAYGAFLNGVNAEVLGVCEYSENLTADGPEKADERIFGWYPSRVKGPKRNYQHDAVFFRRFRQLDRRERFYSRHRQDTYYEAVKLDVYGRGVWFVETHLDFGDAAMVAVRESQMRTLIEDFRDEPYVVIGGDFNVTEIRPDGTRRFTVEQYDLFREAGYAAANDGTVATAKRGAPLDNVFVRGLEMREVAFHKAGELSDHDAVSCTLAFARGS